MNVIPMHVTRAAKEQGVAAAAGMHAMSQGLSPIQVEAVIRFARNRYRKDGYSPARAVAAARAEALRNRSGGGAA